MLFSPSSTASPTMSSRPFLLAPAGSGSAMPAVWVLPAANKAAFSTGAPLPVSDTFSAFRLPPAAGMSGDSARSDGTLSISPDKSKSVSKDTASSRWNAVGKAGLFVLSALLLRHLPTTSTRLHHSLISPDWKEWAKVGLGIAAINQTNQAIGWQPPLWLNAMLNVVLVNPLVTGFSRHNLIQGLILAPVVGVLAQGSHTLGEKAEAPLEKHLGVPPLVTRILVSTAAMLTGLKIFPRINAAIPKMESSAAGMAVQTGVMTTCANGCCTSVVCVNDAGQLGAMLVRSVQESPDLESGQRTDKKAERNSR